MIWYLLYPFRGTAEAPVLDPSHPLCRAFARYGGYAARHVIATLLISSAVATILIYPFPFLYTTDFTNGASNLPHHVWTSAQPIERSDIEPDVIMRSIWVHGSYMKALDRDVLLGALELQDQLLGSTEGFSPRGSQGGILLEDGAMTHNLSPRDRDALHVVNGLTDQSWFFHSPLLYWACSSERISKDNDILSTVNQRKTQSTSVNITLRHSIVFSGKHFEDRRLLAADALVITLVHLRDSPVGRQWERNAEALATSMAHRWTAYPADGRTMSSQLYKFQFRPMSLQDTALLAMAYGLSLTYFLISMSKLRAVKSKTGLIITVMSQILLSIFSSLTVCAVFNIDLSRIPQAAFPLVVLSMSLENVFRLINAVIMTPAEDSSSSRISQAFGQTGHVALASTAQNLLILWGLSKVVSPGVAAFCTFAAVAIVFDFFYLSTFFLSVLSVDVRRTELSDALDRASIRNKRRESESPTRSSWFDALLRSEVALSTRIAGTIIMVGFVLIAQWHFFENETILTLLGRILNLGKEDGSFLREQESLMVDVHQARSPTSWLKLQDHDTAREVINVIKPWATSYVAKVYEPLVLVMRGADRTPTDHLRPLLPALYDFVDHHLTRFVVTVLFLLAAIRLLMNFLLWGGELEDAKSDGGSDNEPLVSIKSLKNGHVLDVGMLSASPDGHIVSVGLDRTIKAWDLRSGSDKALGDISRPLEDPFPILSMAIDHNGTWLGILSPTKAQLWSFVEQRWCTPMTVNLHGQKPQAFFFDPETTDKRPQPIIVRRNGLMTQLTPCFQDSEDFVICKSPLVSVETLVQKDATSRGPRLSILTASRKGCIHVATRARAERKWQSISLDLHSAEDRDALQVVPLSGLDCFLIARHRSVDLVDGETNLLVHTFNTNPIQARSLRCFHSARRKPQCGSVGLITFGIAYNHAETGDCIIQTYAPQEEGDTICFRTSGIPPSKTCCCWDDTKMTETQINNPGTWDVLSNGFVLGVRRKRLTSSSQKSGRYSSPQRTGLRRRIASYAQDNEDKSFASGKSEAWEVWVACRSGRQHILETEPLCNTDIDHDDSLYQQLMVSELGPMTKVGLTSVVVGFGNVLKLVTIGHERFEDGRTAGRADEPWNVGSRRRKYGHSAARTRVAL